MLDVGPIPQTVFVEVMLTFEDNALLIHVFVADAAGGVIILGTLKLDLHFLGDEDED